MYYWFIRKCVICGKPHCHSGGSLSDNPREHLGERSPHCGMVIRKDGYYEYSYYNDYVLVEDALGLYTQVCICVHTDGIRYCLIA
jgi:hypothetical protein